jgi:peroxin-6
LIYPHNPVELSLVVLQAVILSTSMSDSAHLDTSELAIASLYAPAAPQVNGHANGQGTSSNPAGMARIIRQGETISVARHSGSPQTLRVLTQDPVQQGIITRDTRIVVATTPHIAQADSAWADTDGVMSESSHGKTHLSMANFDPDAFLSSSLDLHFSSPSRRVNGSPSYDQAEWEPSSHSSTSGSITPKPNGFGHPPQSPPAQVHDVLGEDNAEESMGTRFNAVVAQGRPAGATNGGDREDVCWMGVAGLGRAGIFEGDWVS